MGMTFVEFKALPEKKKNTLFQQASVSVSVDWQIV